MKKTKLMAGAAVLLLSSITFQSCIGSFTLTNKVLTWNQNVSNKFVNELVFFAFWVLPVYEVTALADLLIINSIEFWSGNNPMEANNKVIETEHGNYLILANENGYKIDSPNGNAISFLFDVESQTWSFCMNEGEKTDFLRFKDKSNVQIIGSEGEFVDVELSKEGVNDYIASICMPMMASN